MTRLTALADTLTVDTLDVWHELHEARTLLARIGVDPEWRQHRAEAFAEVHPNLGRPATKGIVLSQLAEEAVFLTDLGMPPADVCERLGQKPGRISQALRHIGEHTLAGTFAEKRVRAA